jgi:predicted HTH domain antitoxin
MPQASKHHAAPSVTIWLPSAVIDALGPSLDGAARCLKQLALIELFRRGEISSGYAAEVLGIRRWDFIKLLDAYEVPYVDMTPEELEEEVELALSLASPPGGPSSPTPAP